MAAAGRRRAPPDRHSPARHPPARLGAAGWAPSSRWRSRCWWPTCSAPTWGFNPAIPIDHAQQPATGSIRYLQSQTPNRFAGLDSKRNLHPLPPDLANRYGLYDARGYDYPVVKRYDTWWRATAGPPEFFSVPTAEAMNTAGAIRGMSLLSVADVIQDPTDPPSKLPGLRLAYDGPDARVYKNVNALPRTFLVDRQQVVDGGDAALRGDQGRLLRLAPRGGDRERGARDPATAAAAAGDAGSAQAGAV